MKMIPIYMPKGCRYMSEYGELINYLPTDRKFILDKTLTGCGGTSLFLNSYLPVVIILPRIQAGKEKSVQHPDCFWFHIPSCNNREDGIKKKMQELDTYLYNHHWGGTPRILVTLDSSDKVISVLKSWGIADSFLFVVDEFHCLMGDAMFKGSTDMNFLTYIDNEARHICYLSATPIPEIFLEHIPQLTNIPYYKLEWDPDVIKEPTLKGVMMKRGESAEKLCGQIIQRYRKNGYFERKLVQDNVVYSREACFFLNEVNSIRNIIIQNGLKPKEVTILCSESKTSKLPKGFTTGGLCTNKNNPVNKTFTFCTKASFEGVDFYSTNASTYIFINAGKECQTLDIILDIPQILGRQRLDINPFKHDATIYYKTIPAKETKEEFQRRQSEMEQKSNEILDTFNNTSKEAKALMVKFCRERALENKFTDNYIDIVQENGHMTIGFNYLVMVAQWNRWHQRNHYYNDPCQLLTRIRSAVRAHRKPIEVKQFEEWYYNASDKDKLSGYANFRIQYPKYDMPIRQNPFIDFEFHRWYDALGYDILSGLKFQKDDVERYYNEMCAQESIREACRQVFQIGALYSKRKVKVILQKIYNSLGLIGKKAKATDLKQYLTVMERQKMNQEEKRVYYIEILNI